MAPEKEQVAPERRASGEMKASKWLQPSAQREGFLPIPFKLAGTVDLGGRLGQPESVKVFW